ncbi:MAG TPA: transposase [Kofleriaceae bacterium]|nr:transposase [Kofleriaceae bacterium]
MSRSRKVHVQQELFKRRGGKRRGAGRKPKGRRAGSPHARRPELDPRHPVHLVLRVADDIGSLRKRDMYRCLREATLAAARRQIEKNAPLCRLVHLSIQGNHVHLLVEAASKDALSRGMQSFQISAAKRLNRTVSEVRGKRRVGAVFPDRFHEEIITSPRQARHALSYVLNNWRKHREDTVGVSRSWKVDPFSTGALFAGWREREGELLLWPLPATYRPMFVFLPQTWLLNRGWRKAGDISYRSVPGSHLPRAVVR